jgi:WD40 repeat protein
MSSDGKLLAAARVNEFDHPISVWDTLTQKVVYTLKGHFDDPCALAFSPDSRVLASAAKDETVRLWDLTSGKLIHTFTGHHTRIWSIAFSPLGRFVASTAADGTVKLWDTHSIPRRLAL